MSNSTFQSLLMESGGGELPESICEYDPYLYDPPDPAYDPEWSNVRLLSSFDGVHGSTTFTDIGPEGRVYTPIGSPELSNAQVKFGATSLYLDGASYLYVDDTGLEFTSRTQAFTFECWVYVTDGTTDRPIMGNTTGSRGWILYRQASTSKLVFVRYNSSGSAASMISTTLIPLNTWVHVGVTNQRSSASGYVQLIIGGKLESFITGGVEAGSSANPLFVGYDPRSGGTYMQGFISNLRMTTSVMRYRANYEVPTAAFGVGANGIDPRIDDPRTVLLVSGNVVADESRHTPKTVTMLALSSLSGAQAKFPGTSLRARGPSAAGQWGFNVAQHADFATCFQDFTVDAWAFLEDHPRQRVLCYNRLVVASVQGDGLLDVTFPTQSGSSIVSFLNIPVPLNSWFHFAAERKNETEYAVWINGVLVASTLVGTPQWSSRSTNVDGLLRPLNSTDTTNGWEGYVQYFRITMNAARYAFSDFTPDTLPPCVEIGAGLIPTSGTEYPRGEAATVQTGQLTLLNHYQPLVGSSTLVRQGGIGLAQYPLPSGNTATYTVTKTLASTAATTTTVQGRLTWGTDGTFTFVNPENGVGTTTTWLSPTGAGASDEYEFRLEIIDNPNNVVTPYSLPFEQYNEVVIDQIIPAYTDITLTEDEGSKTHTLQLQVDIKPKAGSAVAGQSGYVDSWLLTLNFLLTKPAIPVPVYPDFDSGTKVSSESGNVFTWYFNPNGTITSGTINGTQVGRWIDAFDDVAKAAEYRLVVYSDPLPGGFQRVTPTTLIGANMGTSARVRYVNSGTTGSELYVGFTLRVYPLLTNPRYNEANYFGQYTFTMVIPQISGF